MPRYGDGSVYQRKDGRWVAQLRVDGRQVTRYAPTKREALANPEHHKGPSDRTLRLRLNKVLVPRGYVEIEEEGQGGKHRYSWTGKRWGDGA